MLKKTPHRILLVLLLGLGVTVVQADITSDLLGHWALDGNTDNLFIPI